MANRTFTLDEARNLLPVLESLLRAAMEARDQAQQVEREMTELKTRIHNAGGLLVDVRQTATRKAQGEKAMQRLKDALAEIDSIGVQVKDIDMGLLDFPCTVEGKIVLLCWKLGETTINHWHGLEEGFRGRKVIDESFLRSQKPNQ
ncbi:MAG: DUF2203 domain-containing protein [Acidobacteria bacterium]|nr:DUF2203 domain-containing protein [Acidobacteriota bacterium]